MSIIRDASGWYSYIQENVADKVFYVSQTDGNDSNNGLSPVANPTNIGGAGAAGPLKTLGLARVKPTQGNADWILLKQGDVWSGDTMQGCHSKGRSGTEPAVISAYHPSVTVNPATGAGLNPNVGFARPLVKPGVSLPNGISFASFVGGDMLAVSGIEFYADVRDPNSVNFATSSPMYGINNFNTVTWLRVEDCIFRYLSFGVALQTGTPSTNVFVHFYRSGIFDCYDATNSSGLFMSNATGPADSVGIIIEDSVFDHNGFNTQVISGSQSLQFHNIYIHTECAPVLLRNCISANASATGIQNRSGGVMSDNLFVHNPVAFNTGKSNCYVTRNVIMEANDVERVPKATNAVTAANGSNNTLSFASIPTTPATSLPLAGDYVRNATNPASISGATRIATSGVNTSTGVITLTNPILAPGVSSGDQIYFTQFPRGSGLNSAPLLVPGSTIITNNIFAREFSLHGLGAVYGATHFPTTITNSDVTGVAALCSQAGQSPVQSDGPIMLSTSGGGITAFQTYYAVNTFTDGTGLNGSTFNLSATFEGPPIFTTAGVVTSQTMYVPNVNFSGNIIYAWDGTGIDPTTDGFGGIVSSPNAINLAGTNGKADDAGLGATYKDATRTVAAYGALWGVVPTPTAADPQGGLTALLAECRKLGKSNWRPQFTATAINNWIRDGFNVVNYGRLR